MHEQRQGIYRLNNLQLQSICVILLRSIYLTVFSTFVFPLQPLLIKIIRQSVARTVVRAEPDYDAKFDKIKKEAEERLDDKVEELMKNIETVGQK